MINSLKPNSVRPKTRINLQFIEIKLFRMLVYHYTVECRQQLLLFFDSAIIRLRFIGSDFLVSDMHFGRCQCYSNQGRQNSYKSVNGCHRH